MATTDDLAASAKWVERAQVPSRVEREYALDQSLGKFRVGSVKALNAVPLTRGLESEIVYDVPSKLSQMLQRDELDAALVSIVEALFHDRYDVLDGIAVASLGEVKSVFLAHKKPIEEAKEVFCDTASLTSVMLLKVLLAERGLMPEFKPLESYAVAKDKDFVLLIGDPALDFLFANQTHEIFDLGAEWTELTNLPFVYAVWAMRRGVHTPELRRTLREACDFGLDTMDHIINSRTEYTLDFRKDYLGWHIHHHLCSDEKRGVAKFIELLRKYGFGPVYEPIFVS
jgi:predicted solute-binding protein